MSGDSNRASLALAALVIAAAEIHRTYAHGHDVSLVPGCALCDAEYGAVQDWVAEQREEG